jgi:hypothetical protein
MCLETQSFLFKSILERINPINCGVFLAVVVALAYKLENVFPVNELFSPNAYMSVETNVNTLLLVVRKLRLKIP